MATKMVLTPGGYRSRALVHAVGEKESLRSVDSLIRKVDLSSNKIMNVAMAEFSTMANIAPALGSGWITYAYWNNGTGNTITSFKTTWAVPDDPATREGQTIFLFNGIQNYGQNFGILQPVLQWGASAAGGGPFWSVASWYVTSGGQAFHTPLIPVLAGEILTGIMTLTGEDNGLFSYTSEFLGIEGTTLPIQNIAELLWCNETLEAYGVNQCSDYPASNMTALTAIEIQTGGVTPALNWTPINNVQDCGQHTIVVSNASPNGEVDIYYR
jgi:hypothetical protein